MIKKTIKSFVLRAGRVSPRQQFGLDEALLHYVLAVQPEPWCLNTIFAREADTIVEVGFGMGASLLTMAKSRPDLNFIGIEVHRAGIGSLAADLFDAGLTNVRIAPFDACDVFRTCLAPETLAGVQVFFPDPWPKKRHHKRRLIQPEFVDMLVQKTKISGFVHCATDWQDYAEHMHVVLTAHPLLRNQSLSGGFVERPVHRPLTKFEQRGKKLGHDIWDLVFLRQA
jgi:tRNA (guanine-N7-)-methyltransferase